VVAWPDEPVDPFFNVNTPQDHAAAMALAPFLPRRSAAVVLPRGNTGHELLANFATALRQEGVKLGGLLQRGSKSGGDKPEDVMLMALDDGQVFPIMQRLSRAGACTADPHGIAAASAALRRAVALRLAPVLVNKFGPLEAESEGLADEMLAVMAEGLPLLTTVAETRLDAWLRFCGGQCDLLGNDLPSLRRWWQGGGEPGQ
jgi:nucleoside-triphosphatase THEP1